jgi:UDP-glucose 4-epimerase
MSDLSGGQARERDLEALEGIRALVTGGAGVVGSHVVDHLLSAGAAEVVALDKLVRGRRSNLEPAEDTGRVRFVGADIRDRDAVAAAVAGVDVVFHQAALRITLCAEEPRMAFDVMAGGTFNVIEASAEAGVRKLVMASSAAVYGAADVYPTPEVHHPYHDRTLYGALKSFNEGLLRSFGEMRGIEHVALRYFNVYGPRMDIWGPHTEVLVRWMERIESGEPPLILGDGEQTMDLVYVEDVARANILAAASSVSGKVFKVGAGVETSLNELAGALARVMGSDLRPAHGPERAVNPVRRRLADTSQAERFLGFRAEIPLETGLRRLVGWWRAERERASSSSSAEVG